MIRRSLSALSVFAAAAVALSGSTAHADQCEWVPASVAEQARIELSQPGATFIEYCEPCRDDVRRARVERVSSVTVRAVGRGAQHYTVIVNGRAVDLAYLFIRVGGGTTFSNVGHRTMCGARRVSPSITLGAMRPGFRANFVCPPGSRC